MAFVGEHLLDRLHPILQHRLRLLLADPALKGQYGLIAGARTYAQQAALRAAYLAGTGNLAADPDRIMHTADTFPYGWRPRGSWHMIQYDSYAHAADLRRPWHHTRRTARNRVHPLLPKYGLKATVSSEWWHVQALTTKGWVDGPMPPDLEEEAPDMETLYDTETGEAWIAANGKARPLSDVTKWLATWEGPTRRSASMRYVIEDLYTLTE